MEHREFSRVQCIGFQDYERFLDLRSVEVLHPVLTDRLCEVEDILRKLESAEERPDRLTAARGDLPG